MHKAIFSRTLSLLLALLMILSLSSALSACAPASPVQESFFFMDTPITVSLYVGEGAAQEIFSACRAILSELESLWSRTSSESEIFRINAGGVGSYPIDARTWRLLETARTVSVATDGAFDVTIAPLMLLWQASAEAGRLPDEEALTAARNACLGETLPLAENAFVKTEAAVQLDLGGIGKGAAITALIDYLSTTKASGGLVSFGSNVAVFGSKPTGEDFRIALKNPKNEQSGIGGVLSLHAGEVLSVSGDYERYFEIGGEKYHHILDPKTGYPARTGLCSVAVICRDGAVADALSTALFVMGRDAALDLYSRGVYDFEAIFISSDGSVECTEGLRDVFTAQG